MKMRFILGRAGSGKTYKVFNEIKERLNKKEDKKLFLIVPDQYTLQAEFDLISKMDLSGIMGLEVLSFERLAYKILTQIGGIKKTAVNDLGKIMILRRLFDKYSNNLSVYKKASKQPGFLDHFSELICEFKRNDITPQSLIEKTESISEEGMFKRKLQDISFVYEKFNEYMDGRYTDDEDKFNLFIDKLEDAGFIEGSEIWIDGYSGFTSQQRRIIEKLLKKSEIVNICLTIELNSLREKDLFYPTLFTYDKLREICNKNNISYTREILDCKECNNIKSTELIHLEREFFAYPSNTYKQKCKNIEIFTATNPYNEMERAASEIVSLVRDKNYRWKDVAVVAPLMDTYGSIIKKVFTEYQIPFFIDEKRSIMNNIIIKFILSALDMISKNFRYEDVFRHLKTGFSDVTKDETELLENYCLRYGIKGQKWFKDFEYEDINILELNEIRKRIIKPFKTLKKELRNQSKVDMMTMAVVEFLNNVHIEEKLNNWIDSLKEKQSFEYVNENTQIWNIVMEVFHQLIEILGDSSMTLKEYISVLQAGFAKYQLGIIPPTMDQVLVGSLARSKSHDIKALFVVGSNDGVLPRGISDDGIILDDEKQLLKEAGIQITSDIETRACEERFSVYTMFSKPSKKLYISYPLADNEGAALRKSIYIDRLRSIFPDILVGSDITMNTEKQLHLISTPISTFKYLIEYLRKYVDGNELVSPWTDVYNWYYNNYEWKSRVDNIIEGLFHNNQSEDIGTYLAKELYNTPLKTSISRLEKFINCPFAHFINYGLKPKERKEYKVEKLDIGTLFHYSVERFARKLKEKKKNWHDLDRKLTDELVEEMSEELVPTFENNVLSSSYRYKYLTQKLKRVCKRAVWTLTEHIKKGSFLPYKHEFGFGDGEYDDVPPIVLQLPNGEEIKIEGRIDRIDILDDGKSHYVKIIDYKSGNKKFSLSEVYYGLQLQLIVYLDVFLANKDVLIEKNILTKNDVYPAGVFYFKIDDPMVNIDGEDYEVIELEIMKKLKMDGLVLKDVNVVKNMDKEIETGGRSNIIPAYITNKGELSKNSAVADEEEIKGLIRHVKELICKIAGEILEGNIKIHPCKLNQKTACKFCKFSSICQFDITIEDNEYRNITKLSDKEVLSSVLNERSEK